MILMTKRLMLRPWMETDAENLFAYAGDPDVGPAAGWPPHKNAEESLAVIRNVLTAPECYAVCERENGEAIGSVGLKLNGHTDMTEREDECELGYWLGEPFWGRGIMTAAVETMCREGFAAWDIVRIHAEAFARNAASRRVLEKAGFALEGTLRRSVYKNGEMLDSCIYALVREEAP